MTQPATPPDRYRITGVLRICKWILLSLSLFLSSCVSSIAPPDYHALVATCYAAAVLAPDTGDTVTPDVTPRPTPGVCERCGGRGFQVMGDGHRVPCPDCNGTGRITGDMAQAGPMTPDCCCEDCQCDPCICGQDPFSASPDTSAIQERSRRVLCFEAEWCIPCRKTKPSFEALKKAGWKVTNDVSGHFQLIDADKQQDLMKQYNVGSLPTFVLVVDGKEVHRVVGGPQSPFQLGDIYHFGEK